ncbi:type II toxin-antitoxin system RelE/ParE family toxin [Algoriphagus sp. C2-6-M1]|uniref:type II toxin-antitoxin system RelE/ParE family toxin n=1 Tax=Algoriphagus persicinus TaxID=3108754 RepID=UPI002B38705A|nr:type II toxin-antitoxin system RelE/ParE family toxin [Algoriphagus sp. C2-6-M1]MEB2780005.1 type II toxin-antitoxin system RelE/ParE family toxin [Algoriphagus sp. C2-6-M1]
MAKRKIVWTETAAKQRKSILKYWANHNKSNSFSLKLLRLSNEKAKVIAINPAIFQKADFLNTHVAAMRHLSNFYQFTSRQIIITAFWDNRQDPQKLYYLLNQE